MKSLKKISLGLVLVLSSALAEAQSTLITMFGANAASDQGWVYTAGTSSLSGLESTGDLIYGEAASTNFTGRDTFVITANVSGAAPANGFQLLLLDSSDRIASASFDWADFIGGATKSSPITAVAGFDYTTVGFWNLVGGGSGSNISVVFTSAVATTAVPEPSTYALLSGVAVLGFALRRRRIA